MDVLISGAGIAGPALAHWLSRFGFSVTVVERAPSLRSGGQAVDFRGEVHFSVLRRMGVLDAVLAAQIDERGARVHERHDHAHGLGLDREVEGGLALRALGGFIGKPALGPAVDHEPAGRRNQRAREHLRHQRLPGPGRSKEHELPLLREQIDDLLQTGRRDRRTAATGVRGSRSG